MRTYRLLALLAFALAACAAQQSGGPDFAEIERDFAVPIPDLAPKPCALDSDCVDPMNPRCDAATGVCGICLPTNDNCGTDTYCVKLNTTYRCMQGCKEDVDCNMNQPDLAMASGDGGGGGGNGSDWACCNHICTNVLADAANCGKCGDACPVNGVCCGGGCTDTTKDVNNCGACGGACAGNNASWTCTASKCAVSGCNSTWKDCNNNPSDGCEVNTATDAKNCLGCGMSCAAANAMGVCSNGCVIQSCATGFADCDKQSNDGCEVNIAGDLNNCGGCGVACSPANAVAACSFGQCTVAACAMGFADCDKKVQDGCEVNVNKDVNNCGFCGGACPMLQNATVACLNGVCGIGGCAPGFGDCDMLPGDGCEATLTTDLNNCGACANECPPIAHGTGGCSGGQCVIASCTGTYKDCNGMLNDGCEANLNVDPFNCKSCGAVCPAPQNASAGCSGGVCTIGGCNAGYKDCDGLVANGCETKIATDSNNCGACGNVCAPVMNGSGGCMNGACGIGMCNGTFKDCNGLVNDGCEVDTSNNNMNCGACGNVCPQGQFCGASKCAAGLVVGVWGGITWFKVPVVGTMTDTNIFNACMAAGFNAPCQTNGGGGCNYNDNLCKAATPETSCGNPMIGLSQALCGTNPGQCPALNNVFQYMGQKWVGGCGAVNGGWCAQGNSNSNDYALCIQ